MDQVEAALINALNLMGEGRSIVDKVGTLGVDGLVSYGFLISYGLEIGFKKACLQGVVTVACDYLKVTKPAHDWIASRSIVAAGRAGLNPGAIVICRSLVQLSEFCIPISVTYLMHILLFREREDKQNRLASIIEMQLLLQDLFPLPVLLRTAMKIGTGGLNFRPEE
jgi:hypothetical protein